MGAILRFGNNWLAWGGKLLSMPDSLYAYIVNAFSQGWDRNRAIDTTGGANNNALMGGYLLAASNTTISIPGIRTTDTIVALTPNGLVGTVAVTGTMTFVAGQSYGAFEVYRAGVLIGRYCLTERTSTRLINQYTGAGALPNGLLGGTTTTVWQRSNAFYCETNQRGYSIAGTGWVTNAGESIPVNALVPADLSNPTKCLAWVGGVQQDLQFVGRAKNSISVIPYAFYCNADRRWQVAAYAGTSNTHSMKFYGIISTSTLNRQIFGTIDITTFDGARTLFVRGSTLYLYYKEISLSDTVYHPDTPVIVTGGWDGYKFYLKQEYPLTGLIYIKTNTPSGVLTPITITSRATAIGSSGANANNPFVGYIGCVQEFVNDIIIHNYVISQHTTSIYDTVSKTTSTINGVSTNIYQNIDLVYNIYNQTGYEIWTNGTDYQIYPLASDGTRFITPAGFTIVETVTAGNMPSVADSRFTTFKYALANSYAIRNSVPEAYNADTQATPKLLTYAELSALSSNIKVTKTEVNGKITNITIRQ